MREAFQLSKLKAPDHRPPTLLQLNGDDDNDCGNYLGAELRAKPIFIKFGMGLRMMRRMMMAKTKLNAHDDDQGGWGVKLEMK